MEPFQIFTAVCLAIFLLVRFFKGPEYEDTNSEEGNTLEDRDVMGSVLGTMKQIED